MFFGVEAVNGEGALEAAAHAPGHAVAVMRTDEEELAFGNFARDAGEDPVVLRQIFEERLTAPVGDR